LDDLRVHAAGPELFVARLTGGGVVVAIEDVREGLPKEESRGQAGNETYGEQNGSRGFATGFRRRRVGVGGVHVID
jgi:hypothetical protein